MRYYLVVHLLIMAFSTITYPPLSAQTLKVMTYNIRYDNPGDGVNQWSNRKEKVADLIRSHDPDLVGLQEVLIHQLRDLATLLPEFDYYGIGRDDGKEKGEFSAIFVRRKRLEVLKDSTFWLSPTPDVPGSKGWDALLPRVATWVHLRDKESQKEIRYLNTHFDHRGVLARTKSAELILKYLEPISRKKIPLIMTGDLNVERDTETFRVLTASKLLLDSKPKNNNDPTACGFEVANRKCVGIDYVLHSKETKLKTYKVLNDNDGKYYPSDHLPVVVELGFGSGKK